MNTFIALLAAVGIGSIVSAVISHQVAIAGHRQAWINALRDDIATFVKNLERLAYAVRDWMNESEAIGVDDRRREARAELLFTYERIRLRLNRNETQHQLLERKLAAFVNEPLLEKLRDRENVDAVIDLARKVLKDEWEVTKYPWKRVRKRQT